MSTAPAKRQSRDRYIGQTHGTLTILRELQRTGPCGTNICWAVDCSVCHVEQTLWSTSITQKRVIRCQNCRRLEREANNRHPLYRRWKNVLIDARSQGIHLCDSWHSLEAFAADMGVPSDLSLELIRKDRAAGYEPGNCHWGKREGLYAVNTRPIAVHGVIKTMKGWADICGVSRERIRQLVNKYEAEKAICSFPSAVKWFQENGVMAKVVERFPSYYPDIVKYFDGKSWELTQGVDFDEPPGRFRQIVYHAAANESATVKTRIIGDKFYIKAIK
jgi:hypothetical protein